VDTIDTRLRQMPARTLEPFSLVLRPREPGIWESWSSRLLIVGRLV
jgi:hypothetical protein